MQRWTNDVFPSTIHRVIRKKETKDSRYSVVYFCAPNWETSIHPVSVERGAAPKYPPVQFGDLTPF